MLEPPRRGGSNEYQQSVFEQTYETIVHLKTFMFLV